MLYITAIIYLAHGVMELIKDRNIFTREQFVALFSIIPFMLSAMLIQMVSPNMLLEMFANSLVLLMVTTMVQKPEDYIDTDTGFGKKSAYVKTLESSKRNGKPVNVIMIIITNYFGIHDMLGYSKMQEFIKQIADELRAFNRANKYSAEIFYMGAGKFNLVIDYRHMNKTDEIADKINRAMHRDIVLNGMEINPVTLVCVARFMEDIADTATMLAFEDDLTVRQYNGYVVYASDIYQKEKYDIKGNIDTIIENALSCHNFEVYYQPIFSVRENRFNSAEALLRLKDEKYGFVSPEIFIPAAEKSGAIHRIGAFVLEEVCRFISSDEFKDLNMDYIEVNLSVVQCMRPDLDKEVMAIMGQYGIRSNQLNLEITETAASFSQNVLMDNIDSLTSKGISFSLDDYGTGYSNMRRIASMPFDIVKLDKSFTNEENNPKMNIIVENTIRMIKDMKMKIVVEGIETASLVKRFSDLECDYIQGYYYSKPVTRNEFVKFIKNSQMSV